MTLTSKIDRDMIRLNAQSLADLELTVRLTEEFGQKASRTVTLQILKNGAIDTDRKESYVAGLIEFCREFYEHPIWFPSENNALDVKLSAGDAFYRSEFGKSVGTRMNLLGERLNREPLFQPDIFTQFRNRLIRYYNLLIDNPIQADVSFLTYGERMVLYYERALSIGLNPAALSRKIAETNSNIFEGEFKERYDIVIAALGPAQRVAEP